MIPGVVRRTSGPVFGAATLLLTVLSLHLLGRGALAAPPYRSPDDLQAWLADRGPVTAGVVAIRLLALGVGYHLILTTALSVIGRLLRWSALVRLADASTLPPFRGLVRRIAGLGLSASMLMATPLEAADPSSARSNLAASAPPAGGTASPAGAGAPDGPGAATLRWTDPEVTVPAATATLRVLDVPTAGGTATLRPAPGPDLADPGSSALPPIDGGLDEGTADRVEDLAPTHQVVHGDHLWSIAEERLAAALGHQPSDQEIEPYWRRIVTANPQLVDPDLIFSGDLIHLPPTP